ncbi:MAG: alanine racemase [Gammaproteobacteria bacterium]|nr:alanine racemase [Gammaproteobacteria bacterium]
MIEGLPALTHAVVDCNAVVHNLKVVRQYTSNSKILAVIKANAYGHGLVRIANALQDADALAVARVKEGIELRLAGITNRIVVLQGFLDRDEMDAHRKFDLDPVIYGFHQLRLLATCPYLEELSLWLKLDTGMNRLGFKQEDWRAVLEWLNTHQGQWAELTWMTHLANADDLEDSTTQKQIDLFRSLTADRNEHDSIANSAGILGWKQSHSDWVRPGLMLFGVSPFAGRQGYEFGLKPVMTLRSKLVSIKQLHQGDAVGYGGDWVCNKPICLGVVAIGYGDGYPRAAQSGTLVAVNGQVVPVIGRVSMDMLTVDLSTCPHAQEGDEVELWGSQCAIEQLAKSASTIPYTLLCGITRRVGVMEIPAVEAEQPVQLAAEFS